MVTTDRLFGISTSLAVKPPCKAVSNGALTLSGEQTVNGVAVVSGNRVLVKDQASAADNGIYVANTGTWQRAADFDGNRDVAQGTLVVVNRTLGQDYFYQVDTADPIVIGTSEITFTLTNDPNVTYDITDAETAAGVTPTHHRYLENDIQRYAPEVDFKAALTAGIEVAVRNGRPLRIDQEYELDSGLTIASLAGNLWIEGYGRITYTGSATNYMLLISDSNGNDIRVSGLTMDCDQLAAKCIRVNSPSGSMADIADARFTDLKLLNPYLSTGLSQSASGITLVGGFNEAYFENVLVRNVSRDAEAGNPGIIGSQALMVSSTSINAYCRKTIVRGGEIDTVTTEDTQGSADDVDCDGIAVAGPTATENDGNQVEATFYCSGTTFRNCKGRNVKTQLNGFSIVENFKVVRDLEEAIANARDFDYQRGGGIIRSGVIYAHPTAASGTVWGTSHIVCQAQFDNNAVTGDNRDGSFTLQDITVYNNVPTATDVIPFFMTVVSNDTARTLQNIRAREISIVGGRVSRFMRANVTAAARAMITVDSVDGRFTTSLVDLTAAVDNDVILKLSNNVNLDGTFPTLVALASNADPLITGAGGNIGWAANTDPVSSASALGEMQRVALISGHNDGVLGPGAIVTPRTVTLADDATHAFSEAGEYGFGIITSNFDSTVQCAFSYGNNNVVFQSGTASSNVSVGTSSTNPDTDGDLNIWVSASGVISIKNRLGSSRRFSLTLFTQG